MRFDSPLMYPPCGLYRWPGVGQDIAELSAFVLPAAFRYRWHGNNGESSCHAESSPRRCVMFVTAFDSRVMATVMQPRSVNRSARDRSAFHQQKAFVVPHPIFRPCHGQPRQEKEGKN